MLFFGLGAGPGAGFEAGGSGGFQGSTPASGVGLCLLVHPRHRDLSVCIQFAVKQTLTKSIDTLAHPRATPARTEAWIIRSTRLLRSLGAVCGGWSDWDPTTRGHLAKALQNSSTLVALYGVLASPAAGAGPSVSVRLSTRTEFLLALGGLRVPIFKPPVHTIAQSQTQTQSQIPSTSISQNSDNSETTYSNSNLNNNNNNNNNNLLPGSSPSFDAFEGRSRAIYRHLCVTLLALLPPARETGSRLGLASGPGLGRIGANPCPRRVYASLVLALWGTHYRPASTKDGLLRALLYHNGARYYASIFLMPLLFPYLYRFFLHNVFCLALFKYNANSVTYFLLLNHQIVPQQPGQRLASGSRVPSKGLAPRSAVEAARSAGKARARVKFEASIRTRACTRSRVSARTRAGSI